MKLRLIDILSVMKLLVIIKSRRSKLGLLLFFSVETRVIIIYLGWQLGLV